MLSASQMNVEMLVNERDMIRERFEAYFRILIIGNSQRDCLTSEQRQKLNNVGVTILKMMDSMLSHFYKNITLNYISFDREALQSRAKFDLVEEVGTIDACWCYRCKRWEQNWRFNWRLWNVCLFHVGGTVSRSAKVQWARRTVRSAGRRLARQKAVRRRAVKRRAVRRRAVRRRAVRRRAIRWRAARTTRTAIQRAAGQRTASQRTAGQRTTGHKTTESARWRSKNDEIYGCLFKIDKICVDFRRDHTAYTSFVEQQTSLMIWFWCWECSCSAFCVHVALADC